jgi:hypothetical protein
MRRVPGWALLSSAAAPVLLIGGWTAAATRQPAGYDSTARSISSLAAHGAADRWLMTAALVGVGVCYVVTALGLGPAAPGGRLVLSAGGMATLGVAAFPLPAGGTSRGHAIAAGVAFLALAVWPALGWRRALPRPRRWPLRPSVSIGAAVVLLGLVAWFAGELIAGTRLGLAERAAAGAQAAWPAVVALSARR